MSLRVPAGWQAPVETPTDVPTHQTFPVVQEPQLPTLIDWNEAEAGMLDLSSLSWVGAQLKELLRQHKEEQDKGAQKFCLFPVQ